MALLAFEMPRIGLVASSSSSSAPPTLSAKKEGKKDAAAASASWTSLPMPESIASLLDQSQRLRTATELNAAILTSQSQGKEPKLPGLLKMLAWGEDLLEEKGASFPKCRLTIFFFFSLRFVFDTDLVLLVLLGHFHDLLKDRAKACTVENASMMS